MAETAQWGGSDLCDALIDLYEVDRDRRWPEAVDRVLRFLHDRARGPEAFYPEDWNKPPTAPIDPRHLMHQSAAARAFWRAALARRKRQTRNPDVHRDR